MMNVQKNLLLTKVKNTQVLTAKTERDLLVYQVRAKPLKRVQIALAATQLRKVVMQVKAKHQALEIQTPTHHVAFDVVSNK
ncbi:hypothetical protein [Colwellia maritima]|uniref:hypothetical protein n=1 Tax=Colwellia maritima TaxID=2912588 RepID=UPI0030840220